MEALRDLASYYRGGECEEAPKKWETKTKKRQRKDKFFHLSEFFQSGLHRLVRRLGPKETAFFFVRWAAHHAIDWLLAFFLPDLGNLVLFAVMPCEFSAQKRTFLI